MSDYLGDFLVGATVRFLWSTNDGAGASAGVTGGTVSVYKNNGTTQDTDGITDTRTFDSLTGIHACTIDLSADGTFFSAGADFSVVLNGATIDGQTVNAVLREFSIENRFGSLKDGAITAAKIADNAITNAKIADNALSAAKIAAAALTAAKFDAAAITAGVIATDAIGSAEFAASAVDKIIIAILSNLLTDGTPFAGASIAAIKAKTDNLPSDPADQSLIIAATDAILAILGTPAGASLAADIATRLATSGYTVPPTTAQIADKILVRSIAGGADGGRTIQSALRRIRNRVAIAAGTATVYEEDDSTSAWTAAVTTAAGNPISEINPS